MPKNFNASAVPLLIRNHLHVLFPYPGLKSLLNTKSGVLLKLFDKVNLFLSLKYSSALIYAVILAAFILFLVVDTAGNRNRMISALGIFVIIFSGMILSKHPSRIRWRHVFWGLGLQFFFGVLVLRLSVGKGFVKCIGDKVMTYFSKDILSPSMNYDFTFRWLDFCLSLMLDQSLSMATW